MLSKRHKELRKERNWTQQDLAHKAGLSFNAVTKIEQGAARHPTLKTLLKLTGAFGIGLDELVGKDDI
ncbi:MAG: helix-turn-helix transcriptional regulator [Candidatus Omnitrophica bacterium]|nr:helix-turn-helix transcriptional regulator [Candidatus Omnitrophota bacterium]